MTDSTDHRRAPRYPIHLPAAIVIDGPAGQSTYHGTTCDLSMSGIAILTEEKVPSGVKVNVLLSVPPEQGGESQSMLQMRAYIAYSILATEYQQFRCGMSFMNCGEAARAALERLVERAR